MDKHAIVIFNPDARSPFAIENWIGQIVQKLSESCGYLVTFYPTTAETKPEHILELLRPPLDLIIAAGGDGTVRLALAALAKAKSDIPAAIFPVGTGNVLARNLGIVQEKLFNDTFEHAFDFIQNGIPVRIDLAMMNGEYFSGIAGVGPLSDAFMKPSRTEKSRFRLIAYIRAFLATIALRPHIFKITTGGKSFKVQASGVFVSNVEDLGIGRVVDISTLTDGLLDLHIINPRHFSDYVDLGFRYTGGNRNDHVVDYSLRVKEAIIEIVPRRGVRSAFQKVGQRVVEFFTRKHPTEPPRETEQPCMIDGEECGVTPMRVTVIPQAVYILIPPPEPAEEELRIAQSTRLGIA